MSNRKSIYSDEYRILLSELITAREKSGLTQLDLAKYLQVSQATVSKIENGERRLDIIELRSICNALGIDFIDFLSRLENRFG